MLHTLQVRAFIRSAALLIPIALSGCSSSSSSGDKVSGDAAAGKTAVTKYACTSCHGADLSGQTKAYAGTTATYPANLTKDADTGLGEWDAATIKTAILTGKDDEGEQLCATMPKFQDMKMTDTEATDIVAYLKSLPAVKKEVPESDCASGAAGAPAK